MKQNFRQTFSKKGARLAVLMFFSGMLFFLGGCGRNGGQENLQQGMSAIQAFDYNGALDCFEKGMVNNEDAELCYRGQGIAYIGLTRYEEAAAAFEKALSCSRGQITGLEYDINYYLATAYYKNGDMDSAISVYDAILDLRPKEKDAYYLRGILKLEKGDYETAIKDFDSAVALDAADYDCLLDIYKSLEKNGYQEIGETYLQTALAQGGDGVSDFDRGRISYYLKDYETARNCLEKARDIGGAEAILYLGRTYEALGDYNYAASVYAGFLEENTDHAEIYNQLGLCRMRTGDYEAALTAFQAGIQVENNDFLQTLKYNEIAAYEYLQQYKKATVLMEAYLENYPDDKEATREYEFLRTR